MTQAQLVPWRRAAQSASFVAFATLAVWVGRGAATSARNLLLAYFAVDPLVLIGTLVAAHVLVTVSLFALLTVVASVLFGRLFCGWLCPFGSLHTLALAWARRGRRRRLPDNASSVRRSKYFGLLVLLAAATLGVNLFGVFDPLSLLYRSLVGGLLPALGLAADASSGAVFDADPTLLDWHLTAWSEPVYGAVHEGLFAGRHYALAGGFVLLALVLVLLVVNVRWPRWWCRAVCPLGALLGLLARRPLLYLAQRDADCSGCGLCTIDCPGAAQPDKPGDWLARECFGCLNCVASCHKDALAFDWRSPRWIAAMRRARVTAAAASPASVAPATVASPVNLARRGVLASLAGGLVGAVAARTSPQARGLVFEPTLIRPPGARAEPEFLARCVRCGACIQACPTAALHPAWDEAGLEGVWTPVLVARVGYCEFNCTRCGEACPTGAIELLTREAKQRLHIGLAVIDTARCLPFAFERDCIVCEEHCPTPKKAIYFVPTDVRTRDGTTRILRQPRVDPDLCIGCGACETKCPYRDRAAIRVVSANEARNPANKPFLSGLGGLGG